MVTPLPSLYGPGTGTGRQIYAETDGQMGRQADTDRQADR